MADKLKEPRIYLCIAFIALIFLPWASVSASAGGVSASAGGLSGLTVLFQFFTGFVAIGLPVIMLAAEFVPGFKLGTSIVYLLGAVLTIVCTIISVIFYKSHTGADVGIASTKGTVGAIFYIEIAIMAAVIVITIVKDFALNKDAIKQKGIKGAFSEVASQVKSESSRLVNDVSNGALDNVGAGQQGVTCPSCGAKVAAGKKFCSKCGGKMPASEASAESAGTQNGAQSGAEGGKKGFGGVNLGFMSGGGKKDAGAMTVAEYIFSTQEVKCFKCGATMEKRFKFCPDCGEKVVISIPPETCPKCSAKLVPGKKFCPDCGATVEVNPIQTNCKSCGAELLHDKKYCFECGKEV